MKHSDAQLAAAADWLADGFTPAEAARKVADQFGVSVRTGERVVAAVSSDMSDTASESDTSPADFGVIALTALADAINAARTADDWQAVADRGERLAGAVAKLRIRSGMFSR